MRPRQLATLPGQVMGAWPPEDLPFQGPVWLLLVEGIDTAPVEDEATEVRGGQVADVAIAALQQVDAPPLLLIPADRGQGLVVGSYPGTQCTGQVVQLSYGEPQLRIGIPRPAAWC